MLNVEKVYFLLVFIVSSAVCSSIRQEAVLVADIIDAMKRPSSVIATLCWPIYEKTHLYSALAGENASQITMVQFLRVNDIPKRHEQDQHIVFLVDLACPNITQYFEKSSELKHFRSPFRWLIIDSSLDSKPIIPKAIEDTAILPDAELMVANRITATKFELHSIYRVAAKKNWQSEFCGTWDTKNGLEHDDELLEAAALRRLDLDGFEISVCYVLTDNDSINHLTDGVDDHKDTITKVNFPTTNHLLDFLNASRKYVFADTWGYKVNGTWNGLTGYLVRNEVEIGGSPMFFTSERVSEVDYIASPTPTRSKFVFQQPKLSYGNNLFLLSFRSSVWYSLLGLVGLLFLSLFAVARWEWETNEHDDQTPSSGVLRGNLADVWLLIFGAACQQGSPVELKGKRKRKRCAGFLTMVSFTKSIDNCVSDTRSFEPGSLGRIVMLVLFLALMFLYTSYAANIVALLQSSSSQIKTLDDLLHSRIKMGVDDTVFNKYYFSTATEPTRKAIYQTKVAPPGSKPRFMSMEDGVKSMQKGLFAFHMETGVGYKFVGKFFREGEKCGLKEIQYLQVIDPWLAVRKNTPYKEMFKIGLKRIHEHGLQKRENEMLYEKRPKCSGRESNFVSVSMVDCYPALLVLVYGATLALFLLAMEILVKRREALNKALFRNTE